LQHRSFVWAVAFILLVAISTSNAAEPLATVTKGTDAGILRATLPNGLRVVVVPNSLAPVVTTNLTYLAGSNDAPTGFPGTAHALEHMMFRGSDGLDKDQLAELGARLGGINNAHTSETITEYTFTVPAQDLGLVLKVEALRMRGALLQQGDWEQERGAINQEVSRAVSNPFYNYAAQVVVS
jgi:zinc protease